MASDSNEAYSNHLKCPMVDLPCLLLANTMQSAPVDGNATDMLIIWNNLATNRWINSRRFFVLANASLCRSARSQAFGTSTGPKMISSRAAT